MINRKSISILNKKFKREREEKVKKEAPKLGKHHFDYKTALNKDINFTTSPKKNEICDSGIENLKYVAKDTKKSRNNQSK